MNVILKTMPLDGLDPASITGASLYGMRLHPVSKVKKLHEGIDKAAPSGTPIYATADGKVLVSKMQSGGGGYGNYVVIRHSGVDTLYAHMSNRVAVAGKTVKAGDLIGHVGSTGDSTGAHLHFGICANFNAAQRGWVDPLPYLKAVKEEKMDQKTFNKMVDTYFAEWEGKPVSSWAKDAWEKAVKKGIFDGKAPRGYTTREQVAVILDRLGLL